jgi:4-diphosphocytidyl-2-C-methyl-D-erythritol kinase
LALSSAPELVETAYAKINLALHVRARREDGYHELETLFAFVDAGDRLVARESVKDELKVFGEFAQELSDPYENISFKALASLPRDYGLSIALEKNLPVAAGLGGGSADAGAVFRLISKQNRQKGKTFLPDGWEDIAAGLGADVPACVHSIPCIGTGIGTDLKPISNDIENKPILLVNPRVSLPTGPVFKAWDGVDRGPLPETSWLKGSVSRIAREGRNDLEKPAISLCPVIADVLAGLRDTDAELVRMSGSGATCFALFSSHDVMVKASESLKKSNPDWWQLMGKLR